MGGVETFSRALMEDDGLTPATTCFLSELREDEVWPIQRLSSALGGEDLGPVALDGELLGVRWPELFSFSRLDQKNMIEVRGKRDSSDEAQRSSVMRRDVQIVKIREFE